MIKPNKKFYITTAIPYVNAAPHIGHAIDAIEADVLARYYRLIGYDTFYLTGVDKNGQKNYQSALKEGIKTKEFVDRNTKIFLELQHKLDSSFDRFIETTDEKIHHPGVEKFWKKMVSSGDIYKGTYEGIYCPGHEAFLSESELTNGVCPDHPSSKLERLSEENYLFRYSKYVPKVISLIESGKLQVIPGFRKNEMLNMLRENSADISFSRPHDRVPWGITVPGDNSQVIYVWADALVNYVTGIGYGRDEQEFIKWWPADVHVIGKDILRFHAGIWPAMLLSANLDLPKVIFTHGFVTLKGQKLSKSEGGGINPFELIEKYGSDAVRYFFLREAPPTQDLDFSFAKFENRYNADLASGLGNLVSRVATLVQKLDLELPPDSGKPSLDKKYRITIEDYRFNDSLSYIWTKIAACDKILSEEKPWDILETDPGKAQQTLLKVSLNIREIGQLLLPLLPNTAKLILDTFGNKKIKSVQPIFPRLEKVK